MKFKHFLFILLCTSLKAKAQLDLSKLDWLIGNWEYKTQNILITESWERKSDSLCGSSVTLRNKDTISSELISIVNKNGNTVYNAQVKMQNSGVVVPFVMTINSLDSIVFENKLHDFPQMITYKRVTKDKIMASIQGVIQGKQKRRNFYYIRKKD